jgi:hypothetical protein
MIVQAKNLQPGDILVTGAKVLTVEVRTIPGYNGEEVRITDDRMKAIKAWSVSPDTPLCVQRAVTA